MTPRAVAVQGIGYSPQLVALQGLIEVPELPDVSGVAGGGFRRRKDTRDWAERTYTLAKLHKQDQEVTELLVALVTKGFFNGNG